jgi:outer membrane immunogenic protein
MKGFLISVAAAVDLVAFPALAADPPRKALPPPPAPVVSWSSFYIGGHAGYGWGSKEWAQFDATGVDRNVTNSFGVSGVVAGAQAGYDHQIGSWVFGVEGQWSRSDINGDRRDGFGILCNIADACHTDIKWIATATARLGYAVGATLFYAKGGGAWAREDHRFIVVPTGADDASARETRSGWTVGGGLELRLAYDWSAKIEYNYIDFGDRRLTLINPSGPFFIGIDQQIHLVKVGVNYRFGGPVAANY